MNFIRWVKGWLSRRGHALAEYRSGIEKANKHDYHGAIADYTAAIEGEDTPADVRAMATYNRALAYSAIHELKKAANDLDAVLKMPGISKKIETAALRRRERVRQRAEREEHK